MSLITQKESSLFVDCLDCKFSVVVVHDHDNLESRWISPSDDLEKEIPWTRQLVRFSVCATTPTVISNRLGLINIESR